MIFSIITPSYNRAHILPRAIESVLKQTILNWELIIVDDGSMDGTKDVILNYKDERIKYVYQENTGVCSARNNGISKAKGKYLTFLDSDDYVTNDWLENFYNKIKKKNIDIVFCDLITINTINYDKKIIKATDPYNQGFNVLNGLYLSGAFCIKKSLFITIGGFDKNLKFGEFTDINFRIDDLFTTKAFTNKLGLIYESSFDGGSKNLINKINSNEYLVKKHFSYLKKHTFLLRFYYQNIGISYFKIRNFKKARFYLFKAWIIEPLKVKTLIRLILTFFPKIAKKLIK